MASFPAWSEAWLTLTMFVLTTRVPSAACWTLPAISRVAAHTTGGAYALAAFGRAGSAVALDRLGELVLAPRASVRRRALEAFRFALPAPLARPRLEALLPAAPTDAIRQAVAATLGQLGQ